MRTTREAVGQGALILLVEGHRDTQDMYCQWLQHVGFRVVCCTAADDALSTARRIHPALVATELAMTCDDGRELCEALRSDGPTRHIPILVVTAWATEHFLGPARRLGCDAVLVKPLRPDVMTAEIVRILTAGSAATH